jgi:protease IV
MLFARKVWKILVAIKDGLVLVFMLLFFVTLFGLLSGRPHTGQVREGALLLALNGAVVEEPAVIDPLQTVLSASAPTREYRARDIVDALNSAAKDDRIKAVVLDLSRFTGGGLVHMEEIGAALDAVRAAKKPVLTNALVYTDDGVMLAAHSSEVWVDPLGGALVAGPGGHNVYFGELLNRLKVTAHVYRVGTYKDFVEPYIGSGQSAPSKEARTALLASIWGEWQANVKAARPKADIARVTSDPEGWIRASGGDMAQAALAAGLVDKLGDQIAFGNRVAELVGADPVDDLPGTFAHTGLTAWLAANQPDTPGRAIGVVTVAGEIVDGKAGPGTAGGDRIARLIDEAGADEDLAALVVRVDSPGGSVLASEAIRSAIARQKAKGLPVAVSMANVAASGGYWVSTPASRIFAEPGTITGSIGIFGIIPSFERALADYGVKGDGVRTTPLSGQPDIITGFTPELEGVLQANIEHGYQRFIGLVAQSRGKTPAQIDEIAQGRVWDGGTARQKGLVDEFGGLDAALAWAAKAAKLEAGDWHPLYLGADADPYASVIERLTASDDDEAEPGAQGDLFALAAQRQQEQVGQALDRLGWLLGARGAQAYCMECPLPNRGVDPAARGGIIAMLARFAGLAS